MVLDLNSYMTSKSGPLYYLWPHNVMFQQLFCLNWTQSLKNTSLNSTTVFFYFKWYRERKYSETKYYVSQCPLTLLITLAWTRRFQIIAKVLLKWRKLFIIKRWGETFYSERDWDETCRTAGSSSFSPIPLFSAVTPDKHSLDRLPTDRLRPKVSLISGH